MTASSGRIQMDKNLFPAIIFTLLCLTAYPQARIDTAFIATAKKNTAGLYRKALGQQARLYNGSRYLAPRQTFEEHPYFFSEDWITGHLVYDGEYFREVPLMYDLLNEALITEHLPSGHPILLVREKLEHFSIAGHFFENILIDSVSDGLPKSGFYDVLYGGETKVLASRQKFLREKIEVRTVTVTYEDRNRYFIRRNGVFFPVRSKASVLRLMDDRRQDLKKFLKQQKIVFSDNRELALKSLAEHYDTLK